MPLHFSLIYMDKIIKSDNLKGEVVFEGKLLSALAYADNLTLFGSSERELQH